jgi:hypothetical protein
MATCDYCEREMILAATCRVRYICEQGSVFEFSPYEIPPWLDDQSARCHDCGVRPGGFHHPGCDVTRCPQCTEQFISCGCWDNADQAQFLLVR